MLNESVHIQQELQDPAVQSSSNHYTFWTWNNQIWPISKKKSCWTFKPKTTRAVFSMGFSAAPSQLQTAGWYDIVGSDFQQGTNSVHLPHGEGGGSSRRRRPSFRWGFVGCFHGEVVQLQMWRSVDVCETQPAFFKGGKDGGIRGVKVFVYDVCAQIFHEDGTSIRSGNMNQTTLKHVQVASLLLLLFVVMTTVKCVMHTSMNNMRP